MKSVKTKILVLVITSIIFSVLAVGSASIINSKRVIKEDSVQIMNLLCDNRANEINAMFSKIEQSVNTLAVYATQQLDSLERIKNDEAYVYDYTDSLVNVAENAAENTEGALNVYIRFNPQFTDPESGFFYSRNSENDNFQSLPPTNLLAYDSSDISRVGWFYEPIKNKVGTWMTPYYNENIKTEIISYVVPFYVEDELVGIVGMDIDFSVLKKVVNDTKVYSTGYIFLTDDRARIIYHKDLDRGTDLVLYNFGEFRDMSVTLQETTANASELIQYNYQGIPKKAAFRSLINDMRLVLTAPTSEIDEQATKLIGQIAATVLGIALIAVFSTVLFTRRLVKPLLELTSAAKKIADGDLSVEINHHSKDEVGALADSFRETVAHLHKYISYINELAYRDSLTGVKNKTAYQEVVAQLEEETRLKRPQYAVMVFDINGLKRINDTKGHNFGDILIINACKIISRVFKRSPLYRIGGDEFVVILENTDYESYPSLIGQLQDEIDSYNRSPLNEIKISVAWGIAIYGEETDRTYSDVFKRADQAMYRRKEEMKK